MRYYIKGKWWCDTKEAATLIYGSGGREKVVATTLLLYRGHIEYGKVGGRIVVPIEEIDAYMRGERDKERLTRYGWDDKLRKRFKNAKIGEVLRSKPEKVAASWVFATDEVEEII